jgi:hypothetical protein
MANVFKTLKQVLPFTCELSPFSAHGLFYWATSFMLTRTAIGATRIAADSPTFDNRTDVSRREKQRNQLERIFIEVFGTWGTNLTLHLGQEVAAKVLEGTQKKLAPTALLKATKDLLNPEEHQQLKTALCSLFNKTETSLQETSHVLFQNTFKKAGIAKLAEALNLPHVLSSQNGRAVGVIARQAEHYFRPVNNMAILTTLFGVATGAYFSGTPIQWFNDRILRQKLGPKILDQLAKFEKQPTALQKATLEKKGSASLALVGNPPSSLLLPASTPLQPVTPYPLSSVSAFTAPTFTAPVLPLLPAFHRVSSLPVKPFHTVQPLYPSSLSVSGRAL